MKKVKKLFKFCVDSIIVLLVLIFLYRIIILFLWKFDIIDKHSYQLMEQYWNSGGTFNSFKDCMFGLCLLTFPFMWGICSYKVYKKGLLNIILWPIKKIYHSITKPETLEIERVAIKNLRGKDRSLEEIIADKMQEESKKNPSSHTAKELRKQISAKIGENENQ